MGRTIAKQSLSGATSVVRGGPRNIDETTKYGTKSSVNPKYDKRI